MYLSLYPVVLRRFFCGKYIHDTRYDLIKSSVQMLGQVGIHAVHHRRDIVVVLVLGRLTLTLTLTLEYKIIIEMSPLR